MYDEWTNPDGGSWEDAANWSDGVPDGDTPVLLKNFAGAKPYTVTDHADGDFYTIPGITVDSTATLLVGSDDQFAASSDSTSLNTVNYGVIEANGASTDVDLSTYNTTNYGLMELIAKASNGLDAVFQIDPEPGGTFVNLGTVSMSGSDGILELFGDITNGSTTHSGLIEGPGNENGNAVIAIVGAINNAYGVIDGSVLETSTTGTTTVVTGGTLKGSIVTGGYGIQILDDVTISGSATVSVQGGGGVGLEGAIVNNGLILADSQSDSGANVYIDNGIVTLEGSGVLELSPDGPDNLFDLNTNPSELENVSNTIEGAGDIQNATGGLFVLDNEKSGTIEAQGNSLEITTGSTVLNAGTMESNPGAELDVYDPLQNTGTVFAQEENLDLLGAVTGKGSDKISGATLEFGSSVSAGQRVSFLSAGTLSLEDPGAFRGSMKDFAFGDSVALAGFNDATLHPLRYKENAGGTGGTLTVNDGGGHVAHLDFVGKYHLADFTTAGSGSTQTLISFV
jgi:hypothetical protein